MHDSIETIYNTIVLVYNVTRFLAFYNLNKIKFYYCDYTSNILNDYKTFVKVCEPESSSTKEEEEKLEELVEVTQDVSPNYDKEDKQEQAVYADGSN